MLPSEIKMRSYRGYHQDVFEGWRKLPEATIVGEGYSIEFSRLSERTIDMMCDALNGWYNIWIKFRCEFIDDKGKLSITVRKPEDAWEYTLWNAKTARTLKFYHLKQRH